MRTSPAFALLVCAMVVTAACTPFIQTVEPFPQDDSNIIKETLGLSVKVQGVTRLPETPKTLAETTPL